MVDRHLVRVDQLLATGDPGAALEAMNEILALQEEHDLKQLMEAATGYLSRLFDSHLIADANGLILFEAEAASLSGTEVDESHVETPGFSSYVNITELLRTGFPRSDGPVAGAGLGWSENLA